MRYLLSMILLGALFGCQENPYPDEGQISADKPAPRVVVRPPLSADFPDVIEYHEGFPRDYRFKVSVPSPGRPLVHVDNLPEGATFDPEKLTLTWKPGIFAGNNPGDPTIKSRIYPIIVWLRSSEDTVQAIRKRVNLFVYDVPQGINVNVTRNSEVKEGQTLTSNIKIENTDYPNGPFKIQTESLPVNTQIKKITNTHYQLIWTPNSDEVKVEKSDCSRWQEPCKKYFGKVTVFNPAGHVAQREMNITVTDERLWPEIALPLTIEQGLDVSFQVSAYDANKEIAPWIRLESSRPNFGNFSSKLIRNDKNYTSVLNINWEDIPPTRNGKGHKLVFEVCIQEAKNRATLCRNREITVNFKVRDRKAPNIERQNWPIGTIQYLGHSQNNAIKLPIIDQENRGLSPKVNVFPKEMRQFVSWSNGQLKMNFTKKGIHQFNIIATSEYNVQSAESFLVEVFPKNRSRLLYFSDSTKDKEVKFYKNAYQKLDIMNPVIQEINLRNTSGRETLIIGTSILKDQSIDEKLTLAMTKIKNIVIATPLMDHLPPKFLDKIKEDYRVSIVGRYSELPRTPKLSDIEFVSRGDFPRATAAVQLKLDTSDESHDPILFSTGVDTTNCEPVFEIADKRRLVRFKIGVICDRPNGGRLALLGTEWADLKVQGQDRNIPGTWLKTMISTDLKN